MPRIVRQSAELLRDQVERYVFVSSISVYADFSKPVTEATPVAELDDPATEEIMENYGALKAACERVVEEVYGERSARVRAGLIVGPYDPTDRFTYWPRRIALGGDGARPGRPGRAGAVRRRTRSRGLARAARARRARRHVQRDRPGGAAHVRRAARTRARRDRLRRRHRLGRRASACSTPACSPGWSCRSGCPAPSTRGWRAPTSRSALAAGLTFRPVEETVVDTLAWDRTVDGDRPTLAHEREQEILAAR